MYIFIENPVEVGTFNTFADFYGLRIFSVAGNWRLDSGLPESILARPRFVRAWSGNRFIPFFVARFSKQEVFV